MTHPGVGPPTALAFELVIGTPERFHCGKQIASYVGFHESEMALSDECMPSCAHIVLDIADIVRDRDLSPTIPCTCQMPVALHEL